MPRSINYVRWLHELLFSIYFALLVVTEETWKVGSAFLGRLGYPLIHHLYHFLAYLHHSTRYSPGLLFHTMALWWLLAVIVFVCLHLLGQIAFIRVFLRSVAGFIGVAGFPLFWLHLGNLTRLSDAAARWLLVETIVIAICVVLYLCRKWPTNPTFSVLIVVLHFGLWGWITWDAISIGFWSIYLLLGICTSLVWGLYIRQPSDGHLPIKAAAA